VQVIEVFTAAIQVKLIELIDRYQAMPGREQMSTETARRPLRDSPTLLLYSFHEILYYA
jgi:hypothetical protein